MRSKFFAGIAGLLVLVGCSSTLRSSLDVQEVSECNFAHNVWTQQGSVVGGSSADCFIDHFNGRDSARLTARLWKKDPNTGNFVIVKQLVGNWKELPDSSAPKRVGFGPLYPSVSCSTNRDGGIYQATAYIEWPRGAPNPNIISTPNPVVKNINCP